MENKQHPMPVLTEEQRNDVIHHAIEEVRLKSEHIARLEKNMPGQFNLARYQVELMTAQIALACLTAKPNQIGALDDRGDEYRLTFYTSPPVPVLKLPDEDYFSRLVAAARERAEKAMRKFPQPNYVLNKVAEESGEVIKAVIHYTEGREDWLSVERELIDNLAMLIRLVKEGDQVIGFNPPDEVKRLNGVKS